MKGSYREYRGYLIKKKYRLDAYDVFTSNLHKLYFDNYGTNFSTLGEAKAFIDAFIDGGANPRYNFKARL